jgi:hypothetical protein
MNQSSKSIYETLGSDTPYNAYETPSVNQKRKIPGMIPSKNGKDRNSKKVF